jgi:hypothetical protein
MTTPEPRDKYGWAPQPRDNRGNLIIPPHRVDTRGLRDRLFLSLHGKFWNFDVGANRTQDFAKLFKGLRLDDPDQAKDTLDHIETIAQTARDRADAADRRATTIASSVAIAASFTLTGGGIVVGDNTIGSQSIRIAFASVLFATTLLFIGSAYCALRALVRRRDWSWLDPHSLRSAPPGLDRHEASRQHLLGVRATHLLENFAYNWEVSDLKNRYVDRAFIFLLAGLGGIAGLGGVLVFAATGL